MSLIKPVSAPRSVGLRVRHLRRDCATSALQASSVACSLRSVCAGAVAFLLVTGCDNTAKADAERLSAELAAVSATRDSLAELVAGDSADTERTMSELLAASKFADEVDAELRQVRGLSSRVQPQATDETGRAQAAAARDDILDRLKQLRQRVNTRQSQLNAARDSIRAMRGSSSAAEQLLADLQARLSQRDREIEVFETEIRTLRGENLRLTEEKVALADTVRQVETRENRVHYVVGTKRELLDRGLVTEEGGSRALLVVRLGRTLVPARTLAPEQFTTVDRRDAVAIDLPRADRDYRIVSRHDVSFVEADRKNSDGSFRGSTVRITDPTNFWAPSRFLIIVEK